MTTVKKITKKVNVSPNDLVNYKTGETFDEDKVIHITEETGYSIINYDDYTVFDSRAIAYLQSILSRPEMSSVMTMASDLNSLFNLVFNKTVPHTNETLQQHLGYNSKAMFINLIRKLIKVGVLYQIKGNIGGEVRIVYMFNPYIARKRKKINNDVMDVFKSFEEEFKTSYKPKPVEAEMKQGMLYFK